MFLFFAFVGHLMCASQAADKAPNGGPSNSTVIYISLCYGFSLLVNVWPFYRISGAAFNPAVTLGLTVAGAIPPVRCMIYIPVQIISGICAAAVASGIVPEDIANVQTTLAPGVSVAQGVFIEMFLTALLVFTILMLAVEKSKTSFIAPLGIGLSLFVTQIAGVYFTGASLNPARSFGPCVAAAKFQGYHWIYWIGPGLGALLSAGYFHFLKALRKLPSSSCLLSYNIFD
jgi:aquaporin rerated protein, other eukaryote